MATVYSVDVNVNLLNGLGSGGGGGGAGPGGGAAELKELDRGINDVQRSSERLMGVWGQLFALQMIGRWGDAGVHAFGQMIVNAGNLEESMVSVRLGLGLTTDATDKLANKFYALDQIHKTSALDMAHTAAIMQESGVRSVEAMLQLMEPGTKGGMLAFQDVMKSRAQPMAPDESTRLAMQFITTAAISDPAQGAEMLDLISRALKSDPQASPSGLLNAFQSIHRTGQFAGMSLENQMQLATMTTMGGQTGREATQIGNLMGALELVGHSPGKQKRNIAAQLRKQGILDDKGDPTGDLFSMLDQIAKFRQENPEGAKDFIATAFPDVRKQQEVLELTEPAKLAQLKEVQAQWGKLPGLAEQTAAYMKDVNSQLDVLKSNIRDISSLGGTSLLHATKGVVEGLDSFTDKIKKWQITPEGQHGSAAVGATLGVGSVAMDAAAKVLTPVFLLRMLGLGTAALEGGAGLLGVGAGVAIGSVGDTANTFVATIPYLTTAIKMLADAFYHYVDQTGGKDPDRRIEPALHDVPAMFHEQGYVFSAHPHHALRHLAREMTRNTSRGASAGTGPTLNGTTK